MSSEVRKIRAGKGAAVILPPFSSIREIEAEDGALIVLREMDPDEIERLIRIWRTPDGDHAPDGT